MKQICLKILFTGILFTSAMPTQALEPRPDQQQLGINIAAPLDWEFNRTFADVMKTARDFTLPGSFTPAPVDENGWPQGSPEGSSVSVTVFHYTASAFPGVDLGLSGTYFLQFSGQATIRPFGSPGEGILFNVSYNPGTNITTADIVLGPDIDYATEMDGGGFFSLTFENIGPAGIQNIQLMRPLFHGSDQSYPVGTLLTDQFRDLIEPFQLIRYMDYLATNNNKQTTWAERMPPLNASFHRQVGTGGETEYGWQGLGGSWESVIQISNELQKDAWICIPVRVDEDYIQNLARIFRDGTPGVTRGLDPNLKLYIEFSNEFWNSNFQQYHYNIAQAHAENAEYNYDYDGDGDDLIIGVRRGARLTVDTSRIFREVFGDEAMITRIRPVMAWQLFRDVTGLAALKYIEDVYDTENPVSYHFYAGGGSAYYGPGSDFTNISDFWDGATMVPDNELPAGYGTWREALETDTALAAAFGMHHMSYEGGPGFDREGSDEDNAVRAQAVLDPRITDEIIEHDTVWDEAYGHTLIYFTATGDFQWGFTLDSRNLDTPKLDGINALTGQSRDAVTIGHAPGTISGNHYHSGSQSHYDLFLDQPGTFRTLSIGDPGADWFSYLFNITRGGIYRAETDYYSDTGTGRIVRWMDGVETSEHTITEVAEVATHPADHRVFEEGLHSVRIGARDNNVSVVSLNLTLDNSVDVQAPSAPQSLTASSPGPLEIHLSWLAAEDDYGIDTYEVYRDGRFYAAVDRGTSFIDPAVVPGQRYTYTIRAIDFGSNESPLSAPLSTNSLNIGEGSENAGLRQAYAFPNPFKGRGTPVLRLFVGIVDSIEVTIFDSAGQRVHSGSMAGGAPSGTEGSEYYYDYQWQGNVDSGVYYAVVHADDVKVKISFAVVR